MPFHLTASDHLAVGDDPVPYQIRLERFDCYIMFAAMRAQMGVTS
jgi:hypothetical protein